MKRRMRSFLEDIIYKGELDEIFFEENNKHAIIVFAKRPEFIERAINILWSIKKEFEREEVKEEKPGYIS